jgi:hypothetical protein
MVIRILCKEKIALALGMGSVIDRIGMISLIKLCSQFFDVVHYPVF